MTSTKFLLHKYMDKNSIIEKVLYLRFNNCHLTFGHLKTIWRTKYVAIESFFVLQAIYSQVEIWIAIPSNKLTCPPKKGPSNITQKSIIHELNYLQQYPNFYVMKCEPVSKTGIILPQNQWRMIWHFPNSK